MNIVQVIETYSPIDYNPYQCSEHVVKVMRATYKNGEVEFASFFCAHCMYSYQYTDLGAYKSMERTFLQKVLKPFMWLTN